VACRGLMAERARKSGQSVEPDCVKCMQDYGMTMPTLLERNVAPAQIWLLTRSQLIFAGMGGVVDIDQQALWKNIEMFADEYGIENKTECFMRVLELSRICIEEDNMKAKSLMPEQSG